MKAPVRIPLDVIVEAHAIALMVRDSAYDKPLDEALRMRVARCAGRLQAYVETITREMSVEVAS